MAIANEILWLGMPNIVERQIINAPTNYVQTYFKTVKSYMILYVSFVNFT